MKTSYRERDHAFGQTMLTLRSDMGLTQEGLSNLLGISRRAVGEWEAGSSYPKVEHLKELIALAVKSQAFPEEAVAQEIRALWKTAHQRVLLDESWLASLLEHASPQLYLMPKPVEEGMNSAAVGRQGSCKGASKKASSLPTPTPTAPLPLVDWGNALAVPVFYGREEERALLSQWIVQERCRVVSVLGMGGVGKSTLAVTSMYQLAEHFEVVIFRSLHDAPLCEELLAECLQVFSLLPGGQAQGTVPTEQCISLLLSHLRQVRALVVLDNMECLVEDRDVRGHFRPGFEGYGRLLRRVAETTHQSCLLLTSREKPADLRPLGGRHSPVRSLRLAGLDAAACRQLIEEKGMVGSKQEQEQLIKAYAGNPLALKIVGDTIVDLFGGEIGQFLTSKAPAIFGSITDLLGEQFARLSDLEQTVLYWLAIMREPVTFDELLMLLAYPLRRNQILEAVDSLRQRSLIECGKRPGSFTLQSLVLEYGTAALIAEASSEIQQHRLDRLIQHSLSPAMACEYMRQTQERLVLSPLLADLQSVYPSEAEVEKQLLCLLNELREWAEYAQGYGVANLVALLRLLRGDLEGVDLSHLCVRGVCLPVVFSCQPRRPG